MARDSQALLCKVHAAVAWECPWECPWAPLPGTHVLPTDTGPWKQDEASS